MSIENDITKIAGQSEFSFSGKGGSIEMVGVSSSVDASKRHAVASYAAEVVSSLGQAGNIMKESALGAFVAGSASLAALGSIDAFAIGVGGMAGAAAAALGSKGGRNA